MLPTIISGVISLLTGFFKGEGTSKVAGFGNGLMFYGAIAAGVVWFFSDAAVVWSVTLNGRELIGAVVGGSILLESYRKMNPPSV